MMEYNNTDYKKLEWYFKQYKETKEIKPKSPVDLNRQSINEEIKDIYNNVPADVQKFISLNWFDDENYSLTTLSQIIGISNQGLNGIKYKMLENLAERIGFV